MTDKYRVNFGNGQIHYVGGLRECRNFIKQHGDGFMFIQFRDNDEWFSLHGRHDDDERFQDAMEQSQ